MRKSERSQVAWPGFLFFLFCCVSWVEWDLLTRGLFFPPGLLPCEVPLGVGPGRQFPYEDCHEVALGLVGWWRATRSSQGYPQRCRDGSVVWDGIPRWLVVFCGAVPVRWKAATWSPSLKSPEHTPEIYPMASWSWHVLSSILPFCVELSLLANVIANLTFRTELIGNGLCFRDTISLQCSVSQGYDSLIENLIDVSHVPFAHHGLQGRAERLKSNAQGVCRSAPWGSGRSSWFVVPSLLRQDSPDFQLFASPTQC